MNQFPLYYEPYIWPGVVLTCLKGHPKEGHGVLFIATHVMKHAGVRDAKRQVQRYKTAGGMYQLRHLLLQFGEVDVDSEEAPGDTAICQFIKETKKLAGPRWRDAWFCTQSVMYRMLFRGYSPATEPFRIWITHIVLPSIRQSGSYTYKKEDHAEACEIAYRHCKARAARDPQYAKKWGEAIDGLIMKNPCESVIDREAAKA